MHLNKTESKTENIVFRHFDSDKLKDKIILERQESDNKMIDDLLQEASKKMTNNKGYPDFIIRFTENSRFIIAIECKADITKHSSPNLDKVVDYAVDGALHYGRFLAKNFTVLVIGISGLDENELKVTHYLFKDGNDSEHVFSDKLLSCTTYLEECTREKLEFSTKEDLLKYSKTLNETLHINKIPENTRSLLISGILIALENRGFREGYRDFKTGKTLSKSLINAIAVQLDDANIQPLKEKELKKAYSFIETHPVLSQDKDFLESLISDINDKIRAFIKNFPHQDIIGELYTEFLRYANNDKKLGIVLTPPHITKLFCDIAQVNKNSVIYDNCTGTGGFLIAGMEAMIKNANGDQEKIKEIKSTQLVGVEYSDHIFALACSNMILHGDGKTNIINGDGLESHKYILKIDKETEELIKVPFNPSIGFLNPPYRADKKNDINEWEFVLKNLEHLTEKGICVTILPMSSFISSDKKDLLYKEKLLEKHTLEAVFSMPDDLFYPVGVVTGIGVFIAGQPHSKDKETYFGYWKDDGFTKKKNLGRVDSERWNELKKDYINNFKNKKNIAGQSVTKIVTATDEWCAEAYMETDYTQLSQAHFEDTLRKYASFLVGSNHDN